MRSISEMTSVLRSGKTCAALLLCLVGVPVFAQQTEKFEDWRMVRQGSACIATIDVALRQPSSALLSLAILSRPEGDVAREPGLMTLRVPVGAALAEQPAYTHPSSGNAVGLAWQSCNDLTCMAIGAVSVAELQALKRGRLIFVAFRPLVNARPLVVPVSLLGLTRALVAVDACS